MNKNFTKSILTAIAGLGLIASCSVIKSGKESHKCASKSKEEANKCGAEHGCAAKKADSKTAKTSKKKSK